MKSLPKNHRFRDLTGQKFGRFTVLAFDHQRNKKSFWLCRCECGEVVLVRSDGLTTGHAKSCGCLQKEIVTKKVVSMNKTHGMSGTRFYAIYLKMNARCHFELDPAFKYYGGRGIFVCDEWRNDFETFKNDMFDSYTEHCRKHGTKNTSIDRINNENGYSKDNCRWATPLIQAQNRRPRRAGSKVNQYK